MTIEPKIYVLYENEDWLPPFTYELDLAGIPYETWFVHRGHIDIQEEPPHGIFLNKMSPSSHTRGHIESVDLTRETLGWLESYGRRVINGTRAFALEVSKVQQYAALERAGIRTPRTLAVAGTSKDLKSAARKMSLPFITKHNRGGKGMGVQLFNSLDEFDLYADSEQFEKPRDNITLLQEYIQSPQPFITRIEIVNGEFQYAIRSDTSRGFLLCPADGCHEEDENFNSQSLFSLREEFDHTIVDRYIEFMKENEIELAGIEFVEDEDGNQITYDVNTTTNYSPAVEEEHDLNGNRVLARFLGSELKMRYPALEKQPAL
jgi:hypothetical protein